MTPTIFNLFLSVLPILVVLYLMIAAGWGGSQAGLAGWGAAVLVALLFFGADSMLLLVALGMMAAPLGARGTAGGLGISMSSAGAAVVGRLARSNGELSP